MPRNGVRVIGEVGLSPEIMVKVDLGGLDISFAEVVLNKSPDEVHAIVAAYIQQASRARAANDIHFYVLEAQARRDVLRDLPETERAYMKKRIDERTRERASWEAAYEVHKPRTPFQLTPKHKQWLETFEAETKRYVEDNFSAAARERVQKELAESETKIRRQRAIMAGTERADMIEMDSAAD